MKFTFDKYPGYTVDIEANPYGGLYYKVLKNGRFVTTDYKLTNHRAPDWWIRRQARTVVRKLIKQRGKLDRFAESTPTLAPQEFDELWRLREQNFGAEPAQGRKESIIEEDP